MNPPQPIPEPAPPPRHEPTPPQSPGPQAMNPPQPIPNPRHHRTTNPRRHRTTNRAAKAGRTPTPPDDKQAERKDGPPEKKDGPSFENDPIIKELTDKLAKNPDDPTRTIGADRSSPARELTALPSMISATRCG